MSAELVARMAAAFSAGVAAAALFRGNMLAATGAGTSTVAFTLAAVQAAAAARGRRRERDLHAGLLIASASDSLVARTRAAPR